jgi:hypothetical protein
MIYTKKFSTFTYRRETLLPIGLFVIGARMLILFLFLTFLSCSGGLLDNPIVMDHASQSPYITKVFDYQYAPGQHASVVPSDSNGKSFIGVPWSNGKSYTSLGGWGGYIIAGFDHSVMNEAGPDLAVFTQPSVSSEPGIVYIMADSNKDGVPNDGEWLQIKGSEYDNSETIHNYQVTYFKPVGSGFVTWKDNQGKSGALIPHFGVDSWWWSGNGDKTSITFAGEKLPDIYINTSKDPEVDLWMPRPGLFKYGYAECYENLDYNSTLKANYLEISNAVNSTGSAVKLASFDFIKIQNGVFQVAGWLNEVSTEISGAADIHMLEK